MSIRLLHFLTFFACRISEQPVTKGWVNMVELSSRKEKKKKRKPFRWLNDWVCWRSSNSTGSQLSPQTGEHSWITVGLFRSWFKRDSSVSRKGKPKIGLKHRNKVDVELRLLKDNVASSHNQWTFYFQLSLFFFCLDFQFVGISKARRSPSGLRCWQ